MNQITILDNDEPSSIRAKCKEHGGKFLAERLNKVQNTNTYDGVQYEYRAVFNSDEEVDEFLEEINASKSDRDIIRGYLTVFFSIHHDVHHDEDMEEEN